MPLVERVLPRRYAALPAIAFNLRSRAFGPLILLTHSPHAHLPTFPVLEHLHCLVARLVHTLDPVRIYTVAGCCSHCGHLPHVYSLIVVRLTVTVTPRLRLDLLHIAFVYVYTLHLVVIDS